MEEQEKCIKNIQQLSSEICSDKLTVRNKAVDSLNLYLSVSKTQILKSLSKNSNSFNVIWKDLYDSSITCLTKHSQKLENNKTVSFSKTQKNVVGPYSTLINTINTYSVESFRKGGARIPSSVLCESFCTILNHKTTRQYFGKTTLHIITNSFLVLKNNINDLKITEFSNLLIVVFEFGIELIDESFSSLSCLDKALEIGLLNFQLNKHLSFILSHIKIYVERAKTDERIVDLVLRINYVILKTLRLDYHHAVSIYMMENIITLCGFYQQYQYMKIETKRIIFQICTLFVDIHYSSNIISLVTQPSEHNNEVIIRLFSNIVNAEIRDKSFSDTSSKEDEEFEYLAALVFLISQSNKSDKNIPERSTPKIHKKCSDLENIICYIQENCNKKGCSTWFSILNNIVHMRENDIEVTVVENLLTFLKKYSDINFDGSKNIRNITSICTVLLKREEFYKSNFSTKHLDNLWRLLSDLFMRNHILHIQAVADKHDLLALLVHYKKIDLQSSLLILQNLMQLKQIDIKMLNLVKETIIVYGASDICNTVNINLFFSRISQSAYEKELNAEFLNLLTEINVLITLTCNPIKNSKNTIRALQENLGSTESLCIEYKYLKRFVLLERNKEQIGHEVNNINPSSSINKQSLNILLNCFNLDTVPAKSTIKVIIYNLIKVSQIIYLYLQLDELKVIESLYTEPLIKKLKLFLSDVEMHYKNIETEQIPIESINRVFNIIALFTEKIASTKNFDIPQENLSNILDLICGLYKKLDEKISSSISYDTTDMKSNIKLMKIQILALYSNTSFQNDKAFLLLQDINFGIESVASPNINYVLRAINFLSYKGRVVKLEIASWIMENIKLICKSYHKDIEICAMIFDILPQVFKSIINYTDLIDHFFIIISSFLKKCYNLIYNAEFVRQIIVFLKDISRCCRKHIFTNKEIRKLFLSVGKFLASPSLLIRFTVIEFLMVILDPSWLFHDCTIPAEYQNFSDELYSILMQNKQLCDDNNTNYNDDLIRNENSSLIQFYISIFGTGCIKQKTVFTELSILCCTQKIRNSALDEIHKVAVHFNCSLRDLSCEFIEQIIYSWLCRGLALEEFPWYLCSENEHNFYTNTWKLFVLSALKCSSYETIKQLSKKMCLPEKEMIENVLEKAVTYLLPKLDNLNENKNCIKYSNAAKLMEISLKKYVPEFEIKKMLKIKSANKAKLLLELCKYFYDEKKFEELYGFTLNIEELPELIISYSLFIKIMEIVLNSNKNNYNDICTDDDNIKAIIKLCNHLKAKIYNSIFTNYKALYLFQYFTITQHLIQCSTNAKHIKFQNYFIKDVMYCLTNLLKDFKGVYWISRALLPCITNLIKVILKHTDDNKCVAFVGLKGLTETAELTIFPDIKTIILQILDDIIDTTLDKNVELLKFIEPIMGKDIFADSKILSKFEQKKGNKREDISIEIKNFLELDCYDSNNIRKLCAKIFTKKSEFIKFVHNDNSKQLPQIVSMLCQKIVNGTEREAMEACKCLGTIGPIYINQYAFICEDLDNFYSQNCMQSAEKRFIKNILAVTEKLLLKYDVKISPVIQIFCEHLSSFDIFVNYKCPEFYILDLFKKNVNVNKCKSLFTGQRSINLKYILAQNYKTHEELIQAMTSYIYNNIKLPDFEIAAKTSILFSKETFLPLCNFLLYYSEEFKRSTIEFLEYFFSEASKVINSSTPDSNIYGNKNAIKCFLELTECLRVANNFKVPINLLNVSNVASYQQANFVAILYLEMWALDKLETSNYAITNKELRNNKEFQKIAKSAFKSIGHTGAATGFLDPLNSRIDYLSINNNWLDLLVELDVAESYNSVELFSENLKRNGLLSLSNHRLNTDGEINYEICWRLCKWNVEDLQKYDESKKLVSNKNPFDIQFERNHFLALKSIFQKDELNVIKSVENARKSIINMFREMSVECIQNLYKYLTYLKLLQQIDEFSNLQFNDKMNITPIILGNWETEKEMQFGNFQSKELVLAHKICLLEISGIRAVRKLEDFYKESDFIGNYMLFAISVCKNSIENKYLAKRYIAKLKQKSCFPEIVARVTIEDAINCWEIREHDIALAMLQNIIQNTDASVLLPRIDAYTLYGKFCSEINKEPFEDIYLKYLKESINKVNGVLLLQKRGKFKQNDITLNSYCSEKKHACYKTIAEIADKEFNQINYHINSPNFQTTLKLVSKSQADAKELKTNYKKENIDDTITWNLLSKNSNKDQAEIKYFYEKKTEYLCISMENYMQFSKRDLVVDSPVIYRIISMWLSNKTNKKLNELIKQHIPEIPSYKFVSVLKQLTAHFNSKHEEFINLLEELIIRIVIEHPHHSLCHIFSLIHAQKDENDESSTAAEQTNLRMEVAKKCLLKIIHTQKCSQGIDELEKISLALIKFANEVLTQSGTNYISDAMKKLKNLTQTHCFTESLPIRQTKNYSDIKYIIKWDEKVELVGGINAPKKLLCLCSDGCYKPQLLKGKDDLSQDAVMQQVLLFLNGLLNLNKENFEQNLKIRTYKVVPLSKRSGILEWCTKTIPLGVYLCGNKNITGAHKHHRPDDWKVSECRKIMQQNLKKDPALRLKVFSKICDHIHPVLQYFFFTKFALPGIWFERRISYINSVAASSIVGFVLGLGDRHCQNILLDNETAEVIHIDFGIAFEMGKVMPTPETVPFRLTRDIVAPMGICEVNGIFRSSCEQTMKILRENSRTLITILEVLLYDPLYSWTMKSKYCPATNSTYQQHDTEEHQQNTVAQRTLIRVQSKLEGREDMQIGISSVETQVQKLIADATNIQNLSRLFPGWDPYL